MNGRLLPNGTGHETINGELRLVAVDHRHPIDVIEPEPEPLTGPWRAALAYASGHDHRTLQKIADGEGVSKQRLGLLVTTIYDRLQIPSSAPGRRKRKTAAHLAADDGASISRGDVNGGGIE